MVCHKRITHFKGAMVQWLGPIWGVNLQVIGAKAKPFMEVKCEELTTGESRGEWHWFSVGQGAAMDFALPLAARFGRRRARARRDIDAACAAIDGGPRPDSGQEPEGTASVKPHTCQLQANSKPFASRVHGRCSGVFFVFSWYSHGILMVFSSYSSPGHPSELRPRSADHSRLFPPFGD